MKIEKHSFFAVWTICADLIPAMQAIQIQCINAMRLSSFDCPVKFILSLEKFIEGSARWEREAV